MPLMCYELVQSLTVQPVFRLKQRALFLQQKKITAKKGAIQSNLN